MASPSGKAIWGASTIGRLLRNEAYVGRAYYNRTASVSDRYPGKGARQVRRPHDLWIAIAVPAIVSDELFGAAQQVSYDNSQWSPRRAEPQHWLLRGLVQCGHRGVSVSCHKMRGRNRTFHYYYYCRNHDPLRAGGEHRRCPERNIRADELDAFVFEQVRATMLRPDVLLTGEAAVSAYRRHESGDDELLAAQLARFDRKIESAAAERRRFADLYQAGFIEREELQRRGSELEIRRRTLEAQRQALTGQREELAQQNRLRERVQGFTDKVKATIDQLDFDQRQKLLRLAIDKVRVKGWQLEIKLRIPLESPTEPPGTGLSIKDRLRSLHGHRWVIVKIIALPLQETIKANALRTQISLAIITPIINRKGDCRRYLPISHSARAKGATSADGTPAPLTMIYTARFLQIRESEKRGRCRR